MNTQTLILAILNTTDASGYEIKKYASEGSFSYFVDISYGSIYPTLSRLEADRLVVGETQSQDGKPDKKVYSITDAGRDEFVNALCAPPASDKFKSEFLLIATNAQLLSPEIVERAINKRVQDLEALLGMLKSLREGCDNPATHWATYYGEHVKRSDLTYLKANRKALIAMAGQGKTHNEAAE